jgi:uncharacterized protein DUF6527
VDIKVLEAHFITIKEGSFLSTVDTLVEAQGVMLLCPKCFAANDGAVGTHSIIVPFEARGVPAHILGGLARWQVSGTSLADLTISPSIQLIGGCAWHGFIRNGDAA